MGVSSEKVLSKSSHVGTDAGQELFEFDGKTIDFTIPEIRVGNRVIPLTLMEAGLLHHLVHHLGKAVSRKSILEEVWGLHEDTEHVRLITLLSGCADILKMFRLNPNSF